MLRNNFLSVLHCIETCFLNFIYADESVDIFHIYFCILFQKLCSDIIYLKLSCSLVAKLKLFIKFFIRE